MNNLRIFETVPEGFNFVESDENRRLLALTLSQAFGDCYYSIPTVPMSHRDYLKLYYELGLQWIDNALKHGVVLATKIFLAF